MQFKRLPSFVLVVYMSTGMQMNSAACETVMQCTYMMLLYLNYNTSKKTQYDFADAGKTSVFCSHKQTILCVGWSLQV